MIRQRAVRFLLAAALLLAAGSTRAGQVEIAPFVGLQYGGAFRCCAVTYGQRAPLDPGLQYGGTVDVPIGDQGFAAEALFARQDTSISGPYPLGLAIERYMVGVREEKFEGRTHFLGVFLVGLTRMAPQGFGSEVRFSAALGLGVRSSLSRHFGLRADARAYWAAKSSYGAAACVNGSCVFAYAGNGIWQGDVTAAVVFMP